jgi:hypothetical protein
MRYYADFGGGRSLSAPMTWGQAAIWKSIDNLAPHDWYLNQGRMFTVAGYPPEESAALLGRLLTRHESLRTRVSLPTGGDDLPGQVVDGDGAIVVEAVDADPDTVHAVARAAHDRQMAARFDNTVELPLRLVFGLVDGLVHRIGLTISHFAVDAPAIDLMMADLATIFTRREPGHPAGRQPVDLAHHQQQPGPQQRSRRVVGNWIRHYERVSPSAFPRVSGVPDGSPCNMSTMVSPALDAATRLVAHRYRVSTSTVLLGATAAVLGAWTGRPACSLATIVHNRFQTGHRDIVGPMNQLGLVVIDVDRPTCADLLTATWRAALQGHWNAYYDQFGLDRALADAGADPGIEGHPYFCFNDVRTADDEPTAPNLTEADLRALSAQTTVGTGRSVERLSWQAILSIHDWADGMILRLGADSRQLPGARMERFLRDIEGFVVEAALRDEPVAALIARSSGAPEAGGTLSPTWPGGPAGSLRS